jgi:hypothetical protein
MDLTETLAVHESHCKFNDAYLLILLILAYGWTTSANRSQSHRKRDRSTIAKPIKAIAQSKVCDRPNLSNHRKTAIACCMSGNDLSAITPSKDSDRQNSSNLTETAIAPHLLT